jgi:hypothetical protein
MKVRIQKLEELKDALHPNNIPTGYDVIRETPKEYFRPPTVGERFNVGFFSSSGVTEILSEDTFKTHSSIYKWEIIEE